MNLTNLVLLSITVTTNAGWMIDFPGHGTKFVEPNGFHIYAEQPKKYVFTNYHFGIIQGTNQIQLLTLQQK